MNGVRIGGLVFLGTIIVSFVAADPPAGRSPKQALKAFNDLIGTWNGTGTPSGTQQEQQRGFWTEQLSWEWQFKGKDAWLRVKFDKGKHFESGELRYLPDKDLFAFTARTTGKETLTFTGPLKNRTVTLERQDAKTGETQRLAFNLLHSNRLLYRYDVKPQGKALFAKRYQVGATREGESFAAGDGRPECIVSGGLGTIAISYKGQTYYVCCSGCRAEFNEDPEKYVQEYQKKKAGKGQ
jgi:hypothetical protein